MRKFISILILSIMVLPPSLIFAETFEAGSGEKAAIETQETAEQKEAAEEEDQQDESGDVRSPEQPVQVDDKAELPDEKTEDEDSSESKEAVKKTTSANSDADMNDRSEGGKGIDNETEKESFHAEEKVDDVTIIVEAENGVLPEKSTLSVKKIGKKLELKEVSEAVAQTKEAAKIDNNVAASYTYDIKILNEDGKEVEPEGNVNVSFRSDLVKDKNLETAVYHIKEEKDGNDKDVLVAEVLTGEAQKETYTAVTTGFSRYVVEFTYNDLTYVMDGDTEIPLSDVLEYVGLTGIVSAVEGSNDELFSFEEREDGWYVIAHDPFDTNEWMKVTIDGIVYDIVVTDATYYGAWRIKFNANGGTADISSITLFATATSTSVSKTVTYNFSENADSFCRSGYTLAGFATSSTATTPTYLLTDSASKGIKCGYTSRQPASSNPYATTTYYAVWTPFTGSSGTYRGVDWNLSQNGVLTIGTAGQKQTFEYKASETSKSWPWYAHRYDVKSVIFLRTVNGNGSMASMFTSCTALTGINVSNFNTSNVTDTTYMFSDCNSLTSLNLSSFDTSSVTSMSRMFSGCTGLTSLDLSNFDTSSVSDMSYMFSGCSALTSLNLSSFDTSSVTNMQNMFSTCSSLTSLDLSNFDTSNVTGMSYMFDSCSGLTSLDLSSFDTSSVTRMTNLFLNCTGLTSLDLSSFDTGSVTSMSYMFQNCSSLTTIYVSDTWTVSGVTSYLDMFYSCTNLVGEKGTTYDSTIIDKTRAIVDNAPDNPGYLTDFSTHSEIYVEFDSSNGQLRFFRGANNAYTNGQVVGTKTYWTGIETMQATRYSDIPWYSNSTSITSVKFDDKVTPVSTAYWFYDCRNASLTTIDLSKLNTSKVTDMTEMFYNCIALTSLDLSSFDTSSVSNMGGMFHNCTGLTSLDLSSFDTSSVSNMGGMFQTCTALTSLDVTHFDTSSVSDMSGMFVDCRGLTSLDLSNFDTSSVTRMSYLFLNCTGLTSLDLSSFDTGSVTRMSGMFEGCRGLTSLDLSSFDTSNVTDMMLMFDSCSGLTTIYVSDTWDVSNVTDATLMFNSCTNLVGEKGTTYNSSYTGKTRAKIDGGASDPGYLTDIANTEIYAEFDSSTGVLRIFRDISGTYTDEQVVDTKTYWTGIEDIEGETPPKWHDTTAAEENEIRVVIEDPFSPKTAYGLFADMYMLVDISGLNKLNTSNIENMNGMFCNCSSLTSLNVSSFDTSNVTDMGFMFYNCESLTTLDLSNFDTGNVITMEALFEDCRNLTSLDLSSFDTGNVTTMSYMFDDCSSLTSLDVSSFDTSNVTNMSEMFYNCSALTRIFASNGWKTGNATISNSMFTGCTNLVGGQGTTFDASAPVDKTRAKIDGGTSDPGYLTYKAYTFTVTFNANGGTNAPEAQHKDLGIDLILTTDEPTRDGYTFHCWNTEEDGSGASYMPGARYINNASVTLYAQWEEAAPVPTGIKSAGKTILIVFGLMLVLMTAIYTKVKKKNGD